MLVAVKYATLKLVAGIEPKKGHSNSRIGYWFSDQASLSRTTSIAVLAELKEKALKWYNVVIRDINSGVLPKRFIKSLELR